MKKFLSAIAIIAGIGQSQASPVFADPSPPNPPAVLFRTDWAPMPRSSTTNEPALTGAETEITSRRADFDLKGRTAIYSGNVRVKDPRMDLACEILTVRMGQTGGKVESITATGNVSIEFLDDKGQRIHGTGGRAVYTYNVTAHTTNDVIELFDNPMLETVQGTWKGDVITFDRANNNIRATNSRMVIRPDANGAGGPLLSPNMPSGK